mgnify:CR=1 FL=1
MITTIWRIAYEAGAGYFSNRLSTSAAAMAFYTMFAIGPIMIFSIAIAEPFVGKLMAQQAIFDALGTVVAPDQLNSIRRFASQDLFRGGGIAAIIGAAVLLYTGTRVFVELDDGITSPAKVGQVQPGVLRIVIHEGRHRQVRRMCDAVGHEVNRLVRTRIGTLVDATLKPGEWRLLTTQEVRSLAVR